MQVLVCDHENHRVQMFRPDGAFVRKWGSFGSGEGQFRFPRSVAVRGDQVLVSDRGNHRVQVFRTDGTFVCAWDVGHEQFPNGLAVTHTGQILVGDDVETCLQMFM